MLHNEKSRDRSRCHCLNVDNESLKFVHYEIISCEISRFLNDGEVFVIYDFIKEFKIAFDKCS